MGNSADVATSRPEEVAMRRRICALVFVLALAFPVVASAEGEIGDPYGVSSSGDLTAPAPTAFDWIDSVVRFLVVYVGI